MDEASLTSTFTLILWLSCIVVAVLGQALPYARPKPPVSTPPPIQAEILNVELTNDPLAPPEADPPPPAPSQPPPLHEPIAPPIAPPLIAVAEPSPAIAFALPVVGPVRIVESKQAAYVQQAPPIEAGPAPAPAMQTITYGQGEGKQPAPEYPRRAMREGQEGTVVVRFSVGENGRVLAAEASAPSPWPLLNDAAIRGVRERWRFRPGAVRLYEVAIRFELTQ
jgi:protein TonB